MSTARFLIGDVFATLRDMPEDSVDLVLTSPPFLALRSYLPEGHPDKHLEIGSEPTPAEFLDTLLALTAEWGRVLTRTGSIAVELGDTYAGSGGAGGDYAEGGLREAQAAFAGSAAKPGNGWPLDKSMCIIPHLYAASLAYGRNILTMEPSPAGCWRVRNVVAWCRPNPAVGALGDKYRPATSFMVIATKARDRWFDLDAVRTPHKEGPPSEETAASRRRALNKNAPGNHTETATTGAFGNPAGAPPLDHVGLRNDEADLFIDDAWLVSTESYSGSHYATWPRKLLGQPILSMCPKEVCTACGEPRRRMVDNHGSPYPFTYHQGQNGGSATGGMGGHTATRRVTTLGWTDCGCGAPFRRGHVLDPFGGSGTTAVVATGLGRDCTLIDLDERNAELARDRVGMFLEVVYPAEVA